MGAGEQSLFACGECGVDLVISYIKGCSWVNSRKIHGRERAVYGVVHTFESWESKGLSDMKNVSDHGAGSAQV